MDEEDKEAFDSVFGTQPYELCAQHWKPVTRKRWWWASDENLQFPEDTQVKVAENGVKKIIPSAT